MLTLSSELEQRLSHQAQHRGVSADMLAEELLARDLTGQDDLPMPISVANPTAEELLAGLKKLAETATAVRNYPDDFFFA